MRLQEARVDLYEGDDSAFLGRIGRSAALRVCVCAGAMDHALLFKTAWNDMEVDKE